MTQAMSDCITAERFEAAVGYPPKDDDLDRSNCLDAGKITHWHCGWCLGHDKPRFICGCALRRFPEPKPTLQEIQAMCDEIHNVCSIPPEYLAEGKNAAGDARNREDGAGSAPTESRVPVTTSRAAPNYSAITHSLCAGFGIRKFGGRDNG